MRRKTRWINTLVEWDFDGKLLRQEGFWSDAPVMQLGATNKRATNWGFFADGTETASVLIGTVDANPTKGDVANDTVFQYRQSIEEDAGGGWMNYSVKLQYDHNGAGFVDVTASSTHVQAAAGAVTDGESCTTERVGAQSSFINSAGGVDEVDGIAGDGATDFSNSGTEVLFSIQIIGSAVADDDTLLFRVVEADGTVFNNYPISGVGGQITVEVAAAGVNINAAPQVVAPSIPAYVQGVGIDIAAGVQSVASVLPAAVVGQGVDVAAGVQSVASALPAAVVSQGVDVLAAVQVIAANLPAAIVGVGRDIAAAAQVLASVLPIANQGVGQNETPAEQNLSVALPAYTVSTAGGIDINAATQIAAASIPAYVQGVGIDVAAGVQVVGASLPVYDQALGVLIFPAALELPVALPTAIVGLGVEIQPAALELPVALPLSVVSTGAVDDGYARRRRILLPHK